MEEREEEACGGKKWGFVAYDVADAPKCIARCRQRFLDVFADGNDDETFDKVCETLSVSNRLSIRKSQPFWDLYCCDAQLCGVDNVERLGEDPNINWIINTCSNIGFKSVIHPGPPDATYTCSQEALLHKSSQCQRLEEPSPIVDVLSIDSIPKDTAIPTFTKISMSDTTITSVLDPSLTVSKASGNANNSAGEGESQLSTGEQVAIAFSVIISIVVLATMFICLLRIRALHRRKSHCSDTNDDTSVPDHFPTPRSSFTPPPSQNGSHSGPMTPPLRLKERRILPSGLSVKSWTPSTAPQQGFPENPLYSPAKTKLIPRNEEAKKIATSQTAPLLTSLGWIREDGSIRSGNSNNTAGSSIRSARIRSEFDDGSSTRHTRHPSRVHSLASPGPAPNKKLPPTPAENTNSRTLSPTRHGDVGVAIGLVSHNPASGVTLAGPAKDLCELTEEYEREARNSGGSWSGKGGGGPGVALPSPKKTHIALPTSTLGEGDLEKMGGGY